MSDNPIHRLYRHFQELPVSMRTLFTGALLVLGLGYLFASIYVFAAHSGAEGRPGLSVDDIDKLLNKKSGLLGISGASNDMRALEQLAEWGVANIEATLAERNRGLSARLSALGLTPTPDDARGPHFIGATLPEGAPERLDEAAALAGRERRHHAVLRGFDGGDDVADEPFARRGDRDRTHMPQKHRKHHAVEPLQPCPVAEQRTAAP